MTHPTPMHPSLSRRRRRLEILLVMLFGVMLAFPLFQQITGSPRDARLAGAEVREPAPAWTWATWWSGRYAPAADKWAVSHVGLRGFLVRTACQLNYSLLGKIGSRNGTEIVEGRDHWLFEQAYIKGAVRQPPFSDEKADRFARQAARLQEALDRRGIAFALVIAPNKAEIMSEFLPPGIRLTQPRSRKTAYARIAAALQKHGVRSLDSRRLFLFLKDREKNLFPPTGTHWSYYGAWRVWDEVGNALRAHPACRDLPVPAVEKVVWHSPLGADQDLRQLINLWRFEPHGPPPMPYPIVALPPEPVRNRFSALLVGDSFGWILIDAMARSGAFQQIDMLYYFESRYTFPSPSFTQAADRLIAESGIFMGKLERDNIDWESLLRNRQIVILVCTELHLKVTGWGFPESLTAYLDAKPENANR